MLTIKNIFSSKTPIVSAHFSVKLFYVENVSTTTTKQNSYTWRDFSLILQFWGEDFEEVPIDA